MLSQVVYKQSKMRIRNILLELVVVQPILF